MGEGKQQEQACGSGWWGGWFLFKEGQKHRIRLLMFRFSSLQWIFNLSSLEKSSIITVILHGVLTQKISNVSKYSCSDLKCCSSVYGHCSLELHHR